MIKVLALDNDIDILTVVKLILSADGFKVEAITDWRMIYDKMIFFKPDIILLDVSLGGEDGRNISRHLKSDPKYRPIPVILFSAKIDETDLEDSKADGFIAKPFDATQLPAQLRLYLKKKSEN